MNLRVQALDTAYVAQAWPFVKDYIASALEKSTEPPDQAPDYTIDHVQAFLASGQWLLIVAVDEHNAVHGCCTVSFMNYPMHRVAFVTSIGGHLISNPDTMEQLKALLKQRGATKIQGFGRPAIVRLWKRYNFTPKTTLVEVVL